MAEALSLKVDVNVYQTTLDKLDGVLKDLNDKRDLLQGNVDKLGSEVFHGSDVDSAIELAKKQMEYVQNAITKVKAQREAIQKNLEARERQASTLQSDMGEITNKLPDIFANS